MRFIVWYKSKFEYKENFAKKKTWERGINHEKRNYNLYYYYANNRNIFDRAIDNETESKIVEIRDKATNSLEDYKAKYGSDTYGTVAYILNIVRIYSIPVCFLGIAIGAIHQYVIGIRKLDTLERGMAFIVTCVTLLIICQILPLAFAVFIKFGRG